MDSFIGEIRILPYPFAPLNWAFCNGQPVNIRQAEALYAVIGSVFGGDNNTYFNLPNLGAAAGSVGDAPIGSGRGPNLTPRSLGPRGVGSSRVQLVLNQTPAHTHAFKAETTATLTDLTTDPTNAFIDRGYVSGTSPVGFYTYAALPAGSSNRTAFREPALSPVGQGVAHDNMLPYLAMNFCISLAGAFPIRQ